MYYIGSAYVYSRAANGNSWSFQYKLTNQNKSAFAGKWVDIYDTTIFVSKTGDSDSAGLVNIFFFKFISTNNNNV